MEVGKFKIVLQTKDEKSIRNWVFRSYKTFNSLKKVIDKYIKKEEERIEFEKEMAKKYPKVEVQNE